jgi:hypothetical protein
VYQANSADNRRMYWQLIDKTVLTPKVYYQHVHRALSHHRHQAILSVNPPDRSFLQKIPVEFQIEMTEFLAILSLRHLIRGKQFLTLNVQTSNSLMLVRVIRFVFFVEYTNCMHYFVGSVYPSSSIYETVRHIYKLNSVTLTN